MQRISISTPAQWLIALSLAVIALRPLYRPDTRVSADAPRFDHVQIVAPVFLYKGQQGLLLLDKRNGNIWFLGRSSDEMVLKYGEPVLVTQLPLEKLDQAPR
jgi:hypothetical protein